MIEPGRALVGNAGVLLTSVLGVKKTPKKNFVIVDAAMNDLMRPSLYRAFHEILPVRQTTGGTPVVADVVGPVCETGDFLGQDRELPPLASGELLFVRSCGAYGATMASNYNCRPRAPEVLVDGENFKMVRLRENPLALLELEQ